MARVCPEDRPPDLRLPLVRIRRIEESAQIVLTERPVDTDLMLHHVGAERAVREVHIDQRAVMTDDRQFYLGNHERDHPADRLYRPRGWNEYRCLAPPILKDLARVETPARSRWA